MTPTNEQSTYQGLRSAILSLDLVPGEKLSERGLETMLGASRTPIRAALMRLQNEGLIQRAGRGWQVTPIDLTEVRAVMEYRQAIEAGVIALVVDRSSDDELLALRALVESPRDHDDEESGLRDGSDFHLALTRLSRNPFFADAMSGVLTRLSRTRWLGVRTPEARAQARAEHLDIVLALQARDTVLATGLVTAHSQGTRDRLLSYLTEERRRLRGRGLAIIESSATPPPLVPVRAV